MRMQKKMQFIAKKIVNTLHIFTEKFPVSAKNNKVITVSQIIFCFDAMLRELDLPPFLCTPTCIKNCTPRPPESQT